MSKRGRKLKKEDFANICVWRNLPNIFYPDYEQSMTATGVASDGKITIAANGVTKIYKAEKLMWKFVEVYGSS